MSAERREAVPETPGTWVEVLEALYADSWNPRLRRFRSPFAFRGLAGATQGLTTSLQRLAGERPGIDRLEVHLLRNFRKYAHGLAGARFHDSVWHWLTLGQHHGLPTRLLDWTYSPFVALHFATADPGQAGEDAAVWCVNFVEANRRLPRRLARILEAEGSDALTVEMLAGLQALHDFDALGSDPFLAFLDPPALEERMLHQSALVSLMSSPAARLDAWMRQHPGLVRRVRIPAALKWEIRDKLDQANINERILFPGLDGLARWLGRYYGEATAPPPGVPAARKQPPVRRLGQRL